MVIRDAEMTRAKLRDREYFDRIVDFYLRVIPKRLANLGDLGDGGKAGSTFDIWDYCVRLTAVRYSRGDPVPDMRNAIQEVVGMLELKSSTLSAIRLEDDVRQMYGRLDLGKLYESLTLLGFMVSLRFPQSEIAHALQLIGHAGEDALLDHIARALGDRDRPIAIECKFPDIYAPLVEIVSSPIEEQSAKLAKYVDGWYKRMKPIYWYDGHRGAEGAYFGYWCFEAALVAMLFDINDAALAGHPNYPVDLVRNFRATG
jgi:hypothetical protein